MDFLAYLESDSAAKIGVEPVYNAVSIAELAMEKGTSAILMPVTCRKQLYDLSDDMATKIDIQFYADARDALLKAIVE